VKWAPVARSVYPAAKKAIQYAISRDSGLALNPDTDQRYDKDDDGSVKEAEASPIIIER
jgi:hypothetical protein